MHNSLGEVVRALAARDGVEAVVLFSAEGLPIEHAGPGHDDVDAIAALGATLAQQAERLGSAADRGELHLAVHEHEQGLVVLARAGRTEWLAVLAAADADVGPVLFDLRHHAPALGKLL